MLLQSSVQIHAHYFGKQTDLWKILHTVDHLYSFYEQWFSPPTFISSNPYKQTAAAPEFCHSQSLWSDTPVYKECKNFAVGENWTKLKTK